MAPRAVSLDEAIDLLRAAGRIFIPGAAGEPSALLRALEADRDSSEGLDLLVSLVPGINRFDIDRLHSTARVRGLFTHANFRMAEREGRFQALPLSFSGFVRYLKDAQPPPAMAVVQAGAPDEHGCCSLGPTAEFIPTLLDRGCRLLGLINPRVPWVPGAPSIPYDRFEAVVEADLPLATYDLGETDAVSARIAGYVAGLIGDGAAIQVGLGKVPGAVLAALRDRRGLRLFSGMLGPELLDLDAGGCLDPTFTPTSCALVGPAEFYRQLDGYERVHVRGCGVTHDLGRLLTIEGLHAVNSALEVDLLGQVNAELLGSHAVSGVGGGPDFARAARLVRGGLSVIALGASTQDGRHSRIVARLAEGVCSIPRYDVDCVVTEYGIADLRGLTVDGRAEAILAIAAPEHRMAIADRWHDARRRLPPADRPA